MYGNNLNFPISHPSLPPLIFFALVLATARSAPFSIVKLIEPSAACNVLYLTRRKCTFPLLNDIHNMSFYKLTRRARESVGVRGGLGGTSRFKRDPTLSMRILCSPRGFQAKTSQQSSFPLGNPRSRHGMSLYHSNVSKVFSLVHYFL
jgi:hypothetical protein